MTDLTTRYMGLTLRNPVVVGSCGLTNSLSQIQEAEKSGAGAIVLKSLFEEQIRMGAEHFLHSDNEKAVLFRSSFSDVISSRHDDYDLALEYIEDHARQQTLEKYLEFVEQAKKSVSIPVIASINCVTSSDWQFFARSIQDCKVDGLELNIYLLPSDFRQPAEFFERTYFTIIEEVKKYTTIPLALKIGYYASNLAQLIEKLSHSGISAMVLFNRPFNPDIDTHNFRLTTHNIYSSEEEYIHTLRWIGIMAGRTGCDLAASTGNHNAEAVIKQILAGANAVQMVSTWYKNGFGHMEKVLGELRNWMKKKGFESIEDFRGMMSQKNIDNPSAYERFQFMKHYSGIE